MPSDSSRINLELGSMDLKDDSLPKINEKDMVPFAYLDFIREKANEYLDSIKANLKSRKHNLPKDFYECMKQEVLISKERVEGIRAFAIHKIQKLRVRETLLEQMFEEWLIFSIKNRNKVVYDYCTYLKEKVANVNASKIGRFGHQHELQSFRPDELQENPQFQNRAYKAKIGRILSRI